MKQESVVVTLNISFIAAVWVLSICLFFKLKGRLWSIDKGGAAKDVALSAAPPAFRKPMGTAAATYSVQPVRRVGGELV